MVLMKTSITITPAEAKIFNSILSGTIGNYQEKFGEIVSSRDSDGQGTRVKKVSGLYPFSFCSYFGRRRQRAPPLSGLSFVKLDFSLRKNGASNAGPPRRNHPSRTRIKTLLPSHYYSKTWRKSFAKVLIPKDRPWEGKKGGSPITTQ